MSGQDPLTHTHKVQEPNAVGVCKRRALACPAVGPGLAWSPGRLALQPLALGFRTRAHKCLHEPCWRDASPPCPHIRSARAALAPTACAGAQTPSLGRRPQAPR
eukprot:355043-Chlamydomonas_euryale.AAC.1